MLGAKNPDPLRSGGLPYNRDGDARRTIELNAYSKFQALGGALIRSGALIWSWALKILTHWDRGRPYNRKWDARRTIRIKLLNEINLGVAQDFFDKGDHISSNTVWQCLFFISRYFFTHWRWDWLKSFSLALRDTFIGKNIGFLSWAH